MPFQRGNKAAANRKHKVGRERLSVHLGISSKSGLLALFEQYLALQGLEPTNEQIKELASQWAYHAWGERLKREIEQSNEAIIV